MHEFNVVASILVAPWRVPSYHLAHLLCSERVRELAVAEPIQCPSCSMVMPDKVSYCPRCGAPRSHVAARLQQQAAESGIPYDSLLDHDRHATPPLRIEDLQEFAIELVHQNRDPSEVRNILEQNWVPSHVASVWTSQIFEARGVAKRESGIKNILIGGGICALGLIFSLATYAAASPGETYIVAWGAVLFGGFRGLMGIINLLEGLNRS